MKDQIISFQTAQLAKEKGWVEPTLNFYFEDGESKENVLNETVGMDYGSPFTVEFLELIENWNSKWVTKKNGDRCFGCQKSRGYLETFSAPTQSLLQKWLREKHNYAVCVDFPNNTGEKKHQGINYAGYSCFIWWLFGGDAYKKIWLNLQSKTYEDALEKGLQEALKLI